MEKIILIAIALIIIAAGGYFLLKGSGQDSVSTQPEAQMPADPQATTTQVGESEVKEFTIIAKKWNFSPETIVVNQGDTVKLHVESIDVMHGFGLSAFGINEDLELGDIVDIEFVADKTGTFTFTCTVFCGFGHGNMKGQLIVE